MDGEEMLADLFDEGDEQVEECRRTLNKFDQIMFACAEEDAENGPDLLDLLAGMGDLWDEYRQAHEALARIVNDIYRKALA